MTEKIKVEVFGIRNEAPLGGCDCGGACGPVDLPTMGELYNSFEEFIKESNVKDKIEVQFIDLLDDDLAGHEHVKPVIEKGYKLPLTFINRKPAYAGGIDHQKILRAVHKFI